MEVTEYYFENQRRAPFRGWNGKLRPRDPPPFCDEEGKNGSEFLPKDKPMLGWSYGPADGAWEVDVDWGDCDPYDGWAYATDFSLNTFHYPPDNSGMDVVRRRRHKRTRYPIDEESSINIETTSVRFKPPPLPARSQTRAFQSVSPATGFDISPDTLDVDVILHGEKYSMSVNGTETIGWLQNEATFSFRSQHECSLNQIQVFALFPNVPGAAALNPAADALIALSSFKETTGVVTLQGLLQVRAFVEPGRPIGVILNTKVKDRPIVKSLAATAAPRISPKEKPLMKRFRTFSLEDKTEAEAGIPLLGSDAVTAGMLLSKVEVVIGEGKSDEFDSSTMSAREARSLLRPLQHLKRIVTFVDEPPEGSMLDNGDMKQALYTVMIEVIQAEKLKVADVFSSDPYCQLRLAGMSRRTTVKGSTLSPVWNEKFEFPLLSLDWELLCELWDEDDNTEDDTLGEVRIDLKTLPVNRHQLDGYNFQASPRSEELNSWYAVKNGQGRLRLCIRITENVSLEVVPEETPSTADSIKSWEPVSINDIFGTPPDLDVVPSSPVSLSNRPSNALTFLQNMSASKQLPSSVAEDVIWDLTGIQHGNLGVASLKSTLIYPIRVCSKEHPEESCKAVRVDLCKDRISSVLNHVGDVLVFNAICFQDDYDVFDGSRPTPLLLAPPGLLMRSASLQQSPRIQILGRTSSSVYANATLTLCTSASSKGGTESQCKLLPGDPYSYWRWAAAIAFEIGNAPPSPRVKGSGSESIYGPVSDVIGVWGHISSCDCSIENGILRWDRRGHIGAGGTGEVPLKKITAMELSHDNPKALRYIFEIVVVNVQDLFKDKDSNRPRSPSPSRFTVGAKSKPFCKVMVGSHAQYTPKSQEDGGLLLWNSHFSFAVSEKDVKAGGCKLEILRSRRALKDLSLGDAFIPFSNLDPGNEYTETVSLSERQTHLIIKLIGAKGLPRSDYIGLSDPYCVLTPVRHDETLVEVEAMQSAVIGTTLDPQWNETFTFGDQAPVEEFSSIRLRIFDHDMVGTNDPLGEVFIPISKFESFPDTSLELPLQACKGIDYAKLKRLGLKEKLDGKGGKTFGLGWITVILSQIDLGTQENGATKKKGTITVRCSLKEANELFTSWPAKLLEHEMGDSCTYVPLEQPETRKIDSYSMAISLDSMRFSLNVEEDEWSPNKAVVTEIDISPFCKGLRASSPGQRFSKSNSEVLRMEVWENQRKQPVIGWGSGKRRYLNHNDPRRFTDESGLHRVKTPTLLTPPSGYNFSKGWVENKWLFGDQSFPELIRDILQGKPCPEQRSSVVRRRLLYRELVPISDFLSGFDHAGNQSNSVFDFDDQVFSDTSSAAAGRDSGYYSEGGGDLNESVFHVPFEDMLRMVAITPDTLAIEVVLRYGPPLQGEKALVVDEDAERIATIIVGPCFAQKVGSLLLERKSVLSIRTKLEDLERTLRVPVSSSQVLTSSSDELKQKRLLIISQGEALLRSLLKGIGKLDDASIEIPNMKCLIEIAEYIKYFLFGRYIRLQAYFRELVWVMSTYGINMIRLTQKLAASDWNSVLQSISSRIQIAKDSDVDTTESEKYSIVLRSMGVVDKIGRVPSAVAVELLLGAGTITSDQMRAAMAAAATQCYASSIDKLGKHLSARHEGLSPLTAESLLDLFSFILQHDDCVTGTREPPGQELTGWELVLKAFKWRVVPVPHLTKFLPLNTISESYQVKMEDRLRAICENIVQNNTVPLPLEETEGITIHVWEYHDTLPGRPVHTVVPGTAMDLVVNVPLSIILKRFPDHGPLQGALLRSVAGALATLRNSVAARAQATCDVLLLPAAADQRLRKYLLKFLCAMANDAIHLVQTTLPDLEERCELGAQAEDGKAAQALAVLLQVWLDLSNESTQRLARLILCSIEYEFDLKGLTQKDGDHKLRDTRQALREHFSALKGILDEWCYNRLLARIADHFIVRIIEDLVLRAVDGERLQDGDLLRLEDMSGVMNQLLEDCMGEGPGSDLYKQRVDFLDEVVRLLTFPPGPELEDVTKEILAKYSDCQLSVQHMLEMIIRLRPDGDSPLIPNDVQKWADPDNHMGVDVETATQSQNLGMQDHSELSPIIRLFSKSLEQLKNRKSEGKVALKATTALSHPITGERMLLEWDEEDEDTPALIRFGPESKSASSNITSSPPPNRSRKSVGKSIVHVLGWDAQISTVWLELHVTVVQAEGLIPPITLAASKFWCVVDVNSAEGTSFKKTQAKRAHMVSGDPIWEETLKFKVQSLVGTLLVATVFAPTLLHGDEALGSLKIPLTGVKVLPEWNSKASGGGHKLKEEKSRKTSSPSGDGGKVGKWYNLEPEGSGRVQIRLEAIEVGDVVMV